MACAEALDEEEDDSPAWGPYCGCDTCVVREVLYAAWPIVVRSVTDFLPEDIRQDILTKVGSVAAWPWRTIAAPRVK